MQIHELNIKKNKSAKRVGRGGKRGTYSGRGMKGQKARSGASINPLFEGGRSSLVERLKKIPGFKSLRPKKNNINLDDLSRCFKDGDKVTLENLVKVGLVNKTKIPFGVKILGDGKIVHRLSIDKRILVSKSAKKAIEEMGGSLE